MSVPAKKISTTVYITPQQDALLKRLHEVTRVPVAEFIREGIDLVLAKHRNRVESSTIELLGSAADKSREPA